MRRRTFLSAALVAPFVISSRSQARALPIAGRVGGGSADRTAISLAALSVGTWSGNVSLNLLDDSAGASSPWSPNGSNALAPGETCFPSGVDSALWSFGMGTYVAGKKRYILPNAGGHLDGAGHGNFIWDATTGRWTQTEPPTAIVHQLTTPGPPYPPLAGDAQIQPGNPSFNSNCTTQNVALPPAQNTPYTGPGTYLMEVDSIGDWATVPNRAGRFGGGSYHSYGNTVWCPEINAVIHGGKWGYGDSTPINPTLTWTSHQWRIDPDTGQWDQSASEATVINNTNAGPGTPTFGNSQNNHWIGGSVKKIFSVIEGANPFGQLFDPALPNSNAAKTHVTFGFGPRSPSTFECFMASDAGHVGTVIPDVFNPGSFALVGFDDVFRTLNSAGLGIAYYDQIELTTSRSGPRFVPFGNATPPSFGTKNAVGAPAYSLASWWWGGDYKVGSTKLILFDWLTGFYTVETAGAAFTISSVIAGSGIQNVPNPDRTTYSVGNAFNNGPFYRSIQPMPEYVDATSLPFMAIGPLNVMPNVGAVFLYKFPMSVL